MNYSHPNKTACRTSTSAENQTATLTCFFLPENLCWHDSPYWYLLAWKIFKVSYYLSFMPQISIFPLGTKRELYITLQTTALLLYWKPWLALAQFWSGDIVTGSSAVILSTLNHLEMYYNILILPNSTCRNTT